MLRTPEARHVSAAAGTGVLLSLGVLALVVRRSPPARRGGSADHDDRCGQGGAPIVVEGPGDPGVRDRRRPAVGARPDRLIRKHPWHRSATTRRSMRTKPASRPATRTSPPAPSRRAASEGSGRSPRTPALLHARGRSATDPSVTRTSYAGSGFVAGPRSTLPILQIEHAPVRRAGHGGERPPDLHAPPVERRALVGAAVPDREDAVARAHEQHRHVVDPRRPGGGRSAVEGDRRALTASVGQLPSASSVDSDAVRGVSTSARPTRRAHPSPW